MSQLTDKVEKAIENIICDMKLELEYTELVKEGENNIFRVVIDKPSDKVSIDDCEALSRAIEDTVDKIVNVKDGYVLEVSSAGLERKLVNLKLYNKYIGSEVNIKLFKKILDTKQLQGKLIDVNGDVIVLEIDNDKVEINIKDIAHANTVFDFDNM